MNKLMSAVLLMALLTLSKPGHTDEHQKAVLITGASTGIGRNMAETLAEEGYFVYAGARKPADIAALSAIDNVMGVRLDVTVQEEIDAAVKLITDQGRGLFGLVNNAGVLVLSPLIETDEDDMQFQQDVNVFGPYRVTKAFAPLIIESQGRITTTGSISGILSGSFAGPYSISKHAVEAFTDSLATEMEKFGVAVSVIEPGNYNSAIVTTLRQRLESRGQNFEDSRYAQEYARILSGPADRTRYKEPDEVSAALLDFLSSENPGRRYMVVPDEREARITIEKAIEEMVQLNENQRYRYDRDELIAMLDAALERTN